MKTLITYASEYGTTLQYAKKLAKLCNLEYKNINEVQKISKAILFLSVMMC